MNYNSLFNLVAQSLIIAHKYLCHLFHLETFVVCAYKSCSYLCLYTLNFICFNFYILNAFSYKTHCIYCITYLFIFCSWTINFHLFSALYKIGILHQHMSCLDFLFQTFILPYSTSINQNEPARRTPAPHSPSLCSSPQLWAVLHITKPPEVILPAPSSLYSKLSAHLSLSLHPGCFIFNHPVIRDSTGGLQRETGSSSPAAKCHQHDLHSALKDALETI